MKKYLGCILFFINFLNASAQDYRGGHHKTFSYSTEIYFISNDSISPNLDFKWYNGNHDTIQLRDYINKQFGYPMFLRENEIEGDFYLRIAFDSLGDFQFANIIKPLNHDSYAISIELKRLLCMGKILNRKEYPYDYFVLKLKVRRIQN